MNIFPVSNSTQKSNKVTTEKNLTGLVKSIGVNRVIDSPITITKVSNTISIGVGGKSMLINGYRIDYANGESDLTVSLSGSGKFLIYLELQRLNDTDQNLDGTNPIEAGIEAYTDQYVMGSNPDRLELAIVDSSVSYPNNIVPTLYRIQKLNAKDIFVEGATDNVAEYDEHNSDKTLDKVIAEMVIDDGQVWQ